MSTESCDACRARMYALVLELLADGYALEEITDAADLIATELEEREESAKLTLKLSKEMLHG